MSTRILILGAAQFEEIELVTPLDLWRRAGYEVCLASISNQLPIVGQQGLEIKADCLLENCSSDDFDIIFIPGGAGHKFINDSVFAMKLIEEFIHKNKLIVAICAAPTILAPWLINKKATCYPSRKSDIPVWADESVVIDLPFITSQGAGTAHLLALEVIKQIDGEKTAESIQNMTIYNR